MILGQDSKIEGVIKQPVESSRNNDVVVTENQNEAEKQIGGRNQ